MFVLEWRSPCLVDEVKNFCVALAVTGIANQSETQADGKNLIVGYLPGKRTNKLLS